MTKRQDELKELRGLDLGRLQQKLNEAHEELFRLRFRQETRQLDNTAALPNTRKRIARIKAVMAEALRQEAQG